MQRHNSFKLSAITVAVFGIATQSYAAECEVPIKIDNQKGATVANCNIEALESDNNFYPPILIKIKNSDATISDSQINHRDLGSSPTGILDISDSKVSIKNSQMRSYTPPQGFLLKADNSEVSIDNSTLTGVGSSAVKLFVLNNTNMEIRNSKISYPSWYEETFRIHQGHPSVININDTTIEATRLLSDYRDLFTTPEGIITFNINHSKVLTKTLFRSMYTSNKGSIEFNVYDSEMSGRWEVRDNGLESNIILSSSNWKIPYNRLFNDSSINNLNLNNSEVIFERNPEKYQYLTIYGDLSGSGHFELNTDLANQQADKIVVKGTDSGSFTLGIQDSGNEPQAANGRVTLVETQTGQAQFSLKDREYVDAGAYRYRLRKEGMNWVLANYQAETPPSLPSSNADTVAPNVDNAVSPTEENSVVNVVSPALPPSIVPVNSDEASNQHQPVWKSLSERSNALISLRQAQSLLLSQDLHGVHQRLDERKSEQAGAVWVKNANGRQKAAAQNVATDSRVSGFEMDYHQLYVGADGALSENLRLGGFVGSSRADVEFNGEYGKGKLRSQAVGLYATFANADGWYLDNVAKYSRLTATADEKRQYHAFSLSNEVGKRITFGQGWSLTPQAQLALHSLSGKADERRLNLFSARAGVRVAKAVELGSWAIQPYLELNGLAEKANHAKVRVNQYQFDVAENRGRVQTAVGVNAVSGNHHIGLEFSQTYGKQVRQPFTLQVGYRYQW